MQIAMTAADFTPDEADGLRRAMATFRKTGTIESFGENWERILSFIVLSVIDEKWKGHLYDLDHLRESIRYRAYGQRDPLVEYKKEAYSAFVDLMQDLRKSLSNLVFRAQVEMRPALRPQQVSSLSGPSELAGTGSGAAALGGPISASGPPRRAEPSRPCASSTVRADRRPAATPADASPPRCWWCGSARTSRACTWAPSAIRRWVHVPKPGPSSATRAAVSVCHCTRGPGWPGRK